MVFSFISVYLFITVMLTLFLASYVQQRTGASHTRAILFLCLAVNFYMYGYGMEVNASSIEQVMFWNKFQYLGIPFVSALWFTIGLMYNGHFFPIRKKLVAFVVIIPVITFALRMTNEYHHLYMSELSYQVLGSRLMLSKVMGPWMYVQFVHSFSMIVMTFIMYARSFLKRKADETRKIIYMLIASVVACMGLVLNVINPLQLNLDYMVLLLPMTVTMVIASILRHDFLQIKTMARNMAFENGNDAILLLNHNQQVIDYNHLAKKLFLALGFNMKESPMTVIFGRDEALLSALSHEEPITYSLKVLDKVRHYRILTKRVTNEAGHEYGWLKEIRDITEYQEIRNNLHYQATTDDLSGLLNRREFMRLAKERLQGHMNIKGDIYVMMLDLDHFKTVNDRFGHSAGDEVIRQFGKLMKEHFVKDTIVSRFGGEEFAVMVCCRHRDQVYHMAEGLRAKLQNSIFGSEEQVFEITVSIGIAKMDDRIKSLDALLIKADEAMYASKGNGRNQTTEYIDLDLAIQDN